MLSIHSRALSVKILIRSRNTFFENLLHFDMLENNRSTVLEATANFAFLCHKSSITCHTESNEVSNSKLKLDLCNCVKTEINESTAPPQRPHKQGTIFWDALYFS